MRVGGGGGVEGEGCVEGEEDKVVGMQLYMHRAMCKCVL